MIQKDQMGLIVHVAKIELMRVHQTDDLYWDRLTADGTASVYAPGNTTASLSWKYDSEHNNLEITSGKIWPDNITPDARREVALHIKSNIRDVVREAAIGKLEEVMKDSTKRIDRTLRRV